MGHRAGLRDEKRIAAAEGYLALGMSGHALRELDAIEGRVKEKRAGHIERLRGDCLSGSGRFEEAIQAYRRSLAADGSKTAALVGIGCCFKRTGRLAEAVAAMERAYRLAPREPVVLYNLACYHALLGDKNLALSWLGRAIRLEKSVRELAATDQDFDQLRDDPDFQFVAGTRKARGTV